MRTVGNPAERGEAQALVKKTGLNCDVIDAKLLSRTGGAQSYEVACKDGWGWIVMQPAVGPAQHIDCMALAASAKAAGQPPGKGGCVLPLSHRPAVALQTLVDKIHAPCKVQDGVWLGGGGDPPISRYEMSCKEGDGFILDAPQPGSKADISVTRCTDAPAFGMKCTLPSPAKG
jgi:hypothetical protein